MELHRFFRYAIEKMCKEKKSLNHFLYIEIRIDDMNKEYFNFLFFTIHAIDIKQNEIITNSIIYHKLKWQLNQ